MGRKMCKGKEPSDPVRMLLAYKNIFPQDAFCFTDTPQDLYYVTRTGPILDLYEQESGFTENVIWERFDKLAKVPREEYQSALVRRKDAQRLVCGLPTSEEIETLAIRFAWDYKTMNSVTDRVLWISQYDEESIRRIIQGAFAYLVMQGDITNAEKRRLIYETYNIMMRKKAQDAIVRKGMKKSLP